ncbi:MAG TPA: S-methyl-5'-thioadenosine phosphorylase [Candidatus Binataceae bacterium]|nr:S-methyl-5'-thioadenosine phosphorylase [Candidatus Binataceae bacterium]
MAKTVLGVIGGSGFYKMDALEGAEQVELNTPFGPPSDVYYRGHIGEVEIVFLSRHGRGHRISPSNVNSRANVYGMKLLGVEHLISVSAAGSMKEHLAPGDLVVADQFIDRTHRRPSTFFDSGIVVHVSLADPVCADLSELLGDGARAVGARVHQGGTYLCVEGPQFSTRAESALFRSWGVDVISMTAIQEARLSREAEFCYGVLALVTDYDCWHQGQKDVDVVDILRVLQQNVATAQKAIVNLAQQMAGRVRRCKCASALKDAIVTDRSVVPQSVAHDLNPLIGKYLQSES